MGVYRRAALYIGRKRGQTMVLFFLFFIVSAFLIAGWSVLSSADAVAKVLRTSVGGAFYLRPTSNLEIKEGVVEHPKEGKGQPAMTEKNIKDILGYEEVKAYNAINYGYARSDAVDFLPGTGHSEDNNMGKVSAMNDTTLADQFAEKKLELTEGRHIKKGDKNKILISDKLAQANGLKVGDKVRFTHAGITRENGQFVDSIPNKTAFTQAEIVGIYKQSIPQADGAVPTPEIGLNQIFSDHGFLESLKEAQKGRYTGEVNFYVSDPLKLDDIIKKVNTNKSIDWGQYSIRKNDFQYGKIAKALSSIQDLTGILILCICAASLVVLILILTMRMRGRVHEAGILLAVGKSKREIAGQFILEILFIFLGAFLCSAAIVYFAQQGIEDLVFGKLPVVDIDKSAVETGSPAGVSKGYLNIDISSVLRVFLYQAAAMILTVIASCSSIFALKPKEILSKMS